MMISKNHEAYENLRVKQPRCHGQKEMSAQGGVPRLMWTGVETSPVQQRFDLAT